MTLTLAAAYIIGILLIVLSVRKVVFLLSRERRHFYIYTFNNKHLECEYCGKREDFSNLLKLRCISLDEAICNSKDAPKLKYSDYLWKDTNCLEPPN